MRSRKLPIIGKIREPARRRPGRPRKTDDMSHTPELQVKDLHVSVEGKEILKGLDLEVGKGEIHALMGPNVSGKSTFARKQFLPTEVLSSDACRAMVSDDENNQAATTDAFAVNRLRKT